MVIHPRAPDATAFSSTTAADSAGHRDTAVSRSTINEDQREGDVWLIKMNPARSPF
jgi:hypothetical protein